MAMSRKEGEAKSCTLGSCPVKAYTPAGPPRKSRGPDLRKRNSLSRDQCTYRKEKGHWKNECPSCPEKKTRAAGLPSQYQPKPPSANLIRSATAATAPPAAPAGEGGPPAPPPNLTSNRRLQQTQAQVDEVVDIMRVNVDKVLERDQKLSELDDRADALQAGASQFETSAAKLKRKYWWKNLKMMIILGVICAIILIIIIVYFSS
ncbi:unnamed protein product [Rangifer tarandus platyrhynchus]|uniref:Uncharacterized protein n=3 Tax=Rangifer tarandus platyrhynchus TaxID=3082113 RepID=A0AC59YYQ5_RANTA|nr:unnamed protein product [Rangifer tarandus platyrhynchus]CAI9701142.1 unnamed protein product [Rangifer tarandus platyrhynchus]